jgi:hypothetical protein
VSADAETSASRYVPADVSSFGQDASGELYVMSLDGGLYELVAGS